MTLTLADLMEMSADQYILRREWGELGNCWDDPSVEFITPQSRKKVIEAKKVCVGCMVREECLGYAVLTNQGAGVWGGRDPDERRRIVRKIRRAGYRIG